MSKIIEWLKLAPLWEAGGKSLAVLGALIFLGGLWTGITGATWTGLPARTAALEASDSVQVLRDNGQDSIVESLLLEWRTYARRDSISDWTNNCILWRHIDGLPITRRDCDPNATNTNGEAQ